MKLYLTAQEIAEMLGVSRSKAYRIVKELNDDLKNQGYLVIPGKVSRKYFSECFYGGIEQEG